MATFTTQPFHELLDSDKTTPSTVLDSDGKIKQSLHNLFANAAIDDDDTGFNIVNTTLVESGTSPSGKAAYLLTENSDSNKFHSIYKSPSVTSGRYYAYSIDVKRGSGSRDVTIYLGSGGFGAQVTWNLDLDTGEVTSQTNGTKDAAIATELSDGWWTFTVFAEATASSFPSVNIAIADGTDIQYNGDGTSSIYVSRVRMYEASVHVPLERVENGTFDSDVSGWTKEGTTSHTLTYSSGAALLTKDASSSADDAFSQTSIPTVANETYRISFKAKRVSGSGSARLRIADQVGGGTLYNYSYITDTSYVTITDTFTAAGVGVHVYIHCGGGANAGSVEFDDITLTKVINDGIQNDLDGEDFIETSGSAVYHGGLEYNVDGSFRGIQSFEARTNLVKRSGDSFQWNISGSGATKERLYKTYLNAFDAVKFTANGSDWHGLQTPFYDVTSGYKYAVTAWMAKGTSANWQIRFRVDSDESSVYGTWADLTTTNTTTDAGTVSNVIVTEIEDELIKVSFKVNASSTGTGTSAIRIGPRTTTVGETIIVLGGQVENASSPSPYIPTTSSTRTRGGDKLHKPLSEFGYNHDEVTVKVEFESAGTDGNDYPRAFQIGAIDDTGNSERHDVYYDRVAGALVAVNRTNDSNTSYLSLGTGPTNQLVKVMAAFKKDDFAASDDGDTVVVDTVGDMATVDTLFLGNQRNADSLLNGYIKKLIIWPKRLANATLEAESE